ncbi:formate/nitrite transporter family protein [uncultured Celeribacter sp.]|uniref:formate/nitrite transporter family protein n=1 Tax=uncultured Celeribacter sp. TaxID=1303376 RepID=UPI002AA60300|nr:formate/nitrite transporter family protein [uncultured Celeribacter sp.]
MSQKAPSYTSEAHQEEVLEEASSMAAPLVFEVIRREGAEELQRPNSSLAMSAMIAGLALGFSVLGKALFHAYLPDTTWRPLVENLGYAIGFVIVIMGKMQLFTENTITAVVPFLTRPTQHVFVRIMQLWGIVLVFNLAGSALFAAAVYHIRFTEPEVFQALVTISEHAVEGGVWQTLFLGVGAGWLIACLVWMMPNAGSSKLFLIILVTWLISLAGFSHVIAGTCEAVLLMFTDHLTVVEGLFGFILPALVGNILGGTVIFTGLIWAQIRAERFEVDPAFALRSLRRNQSS